ncbi:MAG: hypothetical protein OXD50_04390 [Chloroflexi bacterium]|nr:hypothetical protein [Chloroflexota bacterium]
MRAAPGAPPRRLADHGQATGTVTPVGSREQRVQVGQALDARDRVTAAEAADFALDSALLARAFQARHVEEGVEAEVRMQCCEAVALDPLTSGQHAQYGRLEDVVTPSPRRPAEPFEGDLMSLQECLLALAREADLVGLAEVRNAHHEHR